MTNTRKRVVAGVALCATLAIGIASGLRAQTFQSVYGGKANDAARGGTIHTSDGNIITVGESQSFGAGTYDVYVVKTDCCGNLLWSATYDIGNTGDDFGRNIRVTADGNYVIVGSTTDRKPCCNTKTGADVFVLNIDPSGNVNWAMTYGGDQDDQGTNIELYNFGKEYIVSGRTASFGAGRYDGYLLRIGFDGTLVWARAYGGAGYDSFNSLWPAADGDILATGETFSYSGARTNDVWIVRVNPNGDCNGKFWSNHYGSPKSNEAANDIVEDDKGLITVVGYSTIFTGRRDPYILKVDASGNTFCDNVYLNIKDETNDQFNEVLSLGAANNLDVVAVGTNTSPAFGFGGSDVLLARIDVNCNPVALWHYGMEGIEQGYSIDVVYCDPDNPTSPTQYIMAGMTTSCCFGGEDLYLIRADANKYNSCCNDAPLKMDMKSPGFQPEVAPTCCPRVNVSCESRATPEYNESWKPLCQCCDKALCGCKPLPRPGHVQEQEHLGMNPGVIERNIVSEPAASTAVSPARGLHDRH